MTLSIISGLVERQIPTFGHLGLMPQSVHSMGGHKIQGKDPEAADEISRAAARVEEAGASMILLECNFFIH